VNNLVIEFSPLVHIEIVVRDAEKAYEFLHKVFGAEKTQEKFADFLTSYAVNKVVHVKLGNVILQFIEPVMDVPPEMGPNLWVDHLKQKGPGVHNLTFIVKNIKEAKKALEKEGAKVLLEFALDWPTLLGAKNARPDVPPVAMVGSEEIVGFRLELSESALKGDKVPEFLEVPGGLLQDYVKRSKKSQK